MRTKIGLGLFLCLVFAGSCCAETGYVWIKAKKEDDLVRGVKEVQTLVEGKQGKILLQINRAVGLVYKNYSAWVAVSAPPKTVENLFSYCEGDFLGEITMKIRYSTGLKRNSVQWTLERKCANFEEAAKFILEKDLLTRAGAEKLLRDIHPADRELDQLLRRQGDRCWDLTIVNTIKGESSKVLSEDIFAENIPAPSDEL